MLPTYPAPVPYNSVGTAYGAMQKASIWNTDYTIMVFLMAFSIAYEAFACTFGKFKIAENQQYSILSDL